MTRHLGDFEPVDIAHIFPHGNIPALDEKLVFHFPRNDFLQELLSNFIFSRVYDVQVWITLHS
jgi:hypothetical protein